MKDSHSSPSFSSSSSLSYLDDLLNSYTSPYPSLLNSTPPSSSSSSSSSSPSTSSFQPMTCSRPSPSSSPSYLDDLENSYTSPYSSFLNSTPTSSFSFSSSSSSSSTSSPSSSSFPAMTDLLSSISSSPSFSFASSPSSSNILNFSTSSPFSSILNFPSSSSLSPPPPSSSSPSPFSYSSVPSYLDILNSSASSSPYSDLFNFNRPSFSYSSSRQNDSPPSSNSSSSPSPTSSSIENLISSYYSSQNSPAVMLSSYIASLNSTLTASAISVDESQWKYDVFVSFRGEDTRNSFASHLFQALGQEGYTCFRDNDKTTRGMVIESKLLDAIRHSMVALVLFSKNYADSRWCLNELLEILECHEKWKEDGHLVLPIFYDVEPGEVRKQSGKFGEGFDRCKNSRNWDASQIDKWKVALQEAGNLSGWHLRNDSNGDEANFIRNIVSQLASMKLPAKRRKQLAAAQAAMKKVNALTAGFAQIDAIEAAAPKRNMHEFLEATGKRSIAYVQLAGLIHNPDFVNKLLNELPDQK